MAKRTIMSELKKTAPKAKSKATDDDAADDEIDLSDDEQDDGDDQSDDEDDESEDEKDDDEQDEDDEELKPAGLKALRAERKKNRELQRELNTLRRTDKKKSSKDDDEDDEDDEPSPKIVKRELALKKSSAKAALLEAGASPSYASLLMGKVDFDDVDIDDDGDVEGLEDQIDELKDEYPEFFGKKDSEAPRRRPAPGSRDSGRRERPTVKRSSADQLASRLVGKG